MLLEELHEGRWGGEVEPVGNLQHGEVGGAQQHGGLDEQRFVYPVQDGPSRDALDGCGEVFGCKVEAVGIVVHGVLLAEVQCQQAEEAVAETLVADGHVGLQVIDALIFAQYLQYESTEDGAHNLALVVPLLVHLLMDEAVVAVQVIELGIGERDYRPVARVAEKVGVYGRGQPQDILGQQGYEVVLGEQHRLYVVDELILGEHDHVVSLHPVLLAIDDHTPAPALAEDDDEAALEEQVGGILARQMQVEVDEEVLATALGDESCHVDVLDIVAKFLHSNV